MSLHVPDPERHARYLASGLTRYSYEEIVAAAQEYETSLAAYEDAVQRVWEIIEANAPHGTHWVAWWTTLEEPYSTLYAALGIEPVRCGKAGRTSSESWPVAKWQAAAKANRRLTARLERAISTA